MARISMNDIKRSFRHTFYDSGKNMRDFTTDLRDKVLTWLLEKKTDVLEALLQMYTCTSDPAIFLKPTASLHKPPPFCTNFSDWHDGEDEENEEDDVLPLPDSMEHLKSLFFEFVFTEGKQKVDVFSLLTDKNGIKLSANQIRYLDALSESFSSYFEIKKMERGCLTIKDLIKINEKPYRIHSIFPGSIAAVGDVSKLRIVRFADRMYPGLGAFVVPTYLFYSILGGIILSLTTRGLYALDDPAFHKKAQKFINYYDLIFYDSFDELIEKQKYDPEFMPCNRGFVVQPHPLLERTHVTTDRYRLPDRTAFIRSLAKIASFTPRGNARWDFEGSLAGSGMKQYVLAHLELNNRELHVFTSSETKANLVRTMLEEGTFALTHIARRQITLRSLFDRTDALESLHVVPKFLAHLRLNMELEAAYELTWFGNQNLKGLDGHTPPAAILSPKYYGALENILHEMTAAEQNRAEYTGLEPVDLTPLRAILNQAN